ncbi:MAG: NADH-quinone oxidoreductase subunit L [Bacteroidetes bacterium B1(2017)]|nr:MAG: NADH-quinone oxidoreductase subunit L [Bacteroidetes bacterium B1(2017)]
MDNFLELTNLITPASLLALFPLLGFFVTALFGKQLKHASGWIASGMILVSFLISVYLFLNLPAESVLNFNLMDWMKWGTVNLSFGILIDHLSIVMLLVVTGIGFLIHLYSIGYMHHDEGFSRFFSYLNLFIFFMLVLVMGNSYLVMFIGWEGVGLCSYLLIGFWFKNDSYNDAAKKAFIMNRIGDLGFLVAMFFMLFYFGGLDFTTVNAAAQTLPINNMLIVAVTLLLFVGAMGKSAQIPLYTWLPDAMAGPTPVSALIHAATMVTAGIYMICRSNILFAMAPHTMDVVMWVGVATSLFAAVIGVKQNDIKKVLAYSTVSQLGLMFAALGMGAFESGMFHVVTHAFFKALLFLGAGSVIHAMGGEQDVRQMGGLRKYIKITAITFLIGTIAISGIPPLAGFFSKDEILAAAYNSHKEVWVLLSISSMITAFYMFRVFFLTFSSSFRGTEEQKHHLHESPWTMTVPLTILAVLAAFAGLLGLPAVISQTHLFGAYLKPVFEGSKAFLGEAHEADHGTELMLMGIAFLAAVISLGVAWNFYISSKVVPEPDSETKGFAKWVANKFYIDEFYTTVIVKPIMVMSDIFFVLIDKLIVDLIVMAAAWIVGFTGKTIRLVQTGNTGLYIFLMVIGMMVLMFIQLVYHA